MGHIVTNPHGTTDGHKYPTGNALVADEISSEEDRTEGEATEEFNHHLPPLLERLLLFRPTVLKV